MGMNKHLLLIEDDLVDAALVQRQLKKCSIEYDYHMIHAPNLSEATTLIQNQKFDAIFLDFNLPDSGGIEALRHLNEFCINTPIIISDWAQ